MPFLVGSSSPATLSLVDAGNEPTVYRVNGVLLTAANFVAQQALWTTLVDAAMALVLGAKKSAYYGTKVDYSYSQPTNGAAREIALLVQYKDNTTGQRLTAKLGTLDPSIPDYVINISARDIVKVDSPTVITDFITAQNAFARNPYTGNATTIIGLKVVRGGK